LPAPPCTNPGRNFATALDPTRRSLVRLDNNEIGLVVKVDVTDPSLTDIKILFAANGEQLTEPYMLQLHPRGRTGSLPR